MKELYEYAIAHDISLPSYGNKNKHNDVPVFWNIVNRVFTSLGQRGVRQTLSIALQRLMRHEQ
jgi:hypothetical protein